MGGHQSRLNSSEKDSVNLILLEIAQAGNLAEFEALVNNQGKAAKLKAKTRAGDSAVHLLARHATVNNESSDARILKSLIVACPKDELEKKRNNNGFTPFLCAVNGNNLPVLKALYEAGVLDVTVRDNDGNNPLHLVSDIEVARWLLDLPKAVGWLFQENHSNRQPLQVVPQTLSPLFQEKKEINDNIFSAIERNDVLALKQLVSKEDRIKDFADQDFNNALCLSLNMKKEVITRWLLKHFLKNLFLDEPQKFRAKIAEHIANKVKTDSEFLKWLFSDAYQEVTSSPLELVRANLYAGLPGLHLENLDDSGLYEKILLLANTLAGGGLGLLPVVMSGGLGFAVSGMLMPIIPIFNNLWLSMVRAVIAPRMVSRTSFGDDLQECSKSLINKYCLDEDNSIDGKSLLEREAEAGRLEGVKFLVERGADYEIRVRGKRLYVFSAECENLEILKYFVETLRVLRDVPDQGRDFLYQFCEKNKVEIVRIFLNYYQSQGNVDVDYYTYLFSKIFQKVAGDYEKIKSFIQLFLVLIDYGAEVNHRCQSSQLLLDEKCLSVLDQAAKDALKTLITGLGVTELRIEGVNLKPASLSKLFAVLNLETLGVKTVCVVGHLSDWVEKDFIDAIEDSKNCHVKFEGVSFMDVSKLWVEIKNKDNVMLEILPCDPSIKFTLSERTLEEWLDPENNIFHKFKFPLFLEKLYFLSDLSKIEDCSKNQPRTLNETIQLLVCLANQALAGKNFKEFNGYEKDLEYLFTQYSQGMKDKDEERIFHVLVLAFVQEAKYFFNFLFGIDGPTYWPAKLESKQPQYIAIHLLSYILGLNEAIDRKLVERLLSCKLNSLVCREHDARSLEYSTTCDPLVVSLIDRTIQFKKISSLKYAADFCEEILKEKAGSLPVLQVALKELFLQQIEKKENSDTISEDYGEFLEVSTVASVVEKSRSPVASVWLESTVRDQKLLMLEQSPISDEEAIKSLNLEVTTAIESAKKTLENPVRDRCGDSPFEKLKWSVIKAAKVVPKLKPLSTLVEGLSGNITAESIQDLIKIFLDVSKELTEMAPENFLENSLSLIKKIAEEGFGVFTSLEVLKEAGLPVLQEHKKLYDALSLFVNKGKPPKAKELFEALEVIAAVSLGYIYPENRYESTCDLNQLMTAFKGNDPLSAVATISRMSLRCLNKDVPCYAPLQFIDQVLQVAADYWSGHHQGQALQKGLGQLFDGAFNSLLNFESSHVLVVYLKGLLDYWKIVSLEFVPLQGRVRRYLAENNFDKAVQEVLQWVKKIDPEIDENRFVQALKPIIAVEAQSEPRYFYLAIRPIMKKFLSTGSLIRKHLDVETSLEFFLMASEEKRWDALSGFIEAFVNALGARSEIGLILGELGAFGGEICSLDDKDIYVVGGLASKRLINFGKKIKHNGLQLIGVSIFSLLETANQHQDKKLLPYEWCLITLKQVEKSSKDHELKFMEDFARYACDTIQVVRIFSECHSQGEIKVWREKFSAIDSDRDVVGIGGHLASVMAVVEFVKGSSARQHDIDHVKAVLDALKLIGKYQKRLDLHDLAHILFNLADNYEKTNLQEIKDYFELLKNTLESVKDGMQHESLKFWVKKIVRLINVAELVKSVFSLETAQHFLQAVEMTITYLKGNTKNEEIVSALEGMISGVKEQNYSLVKKSSKTLLEKFSDGACQAVNAAIGAKDEVVPAFGSVASAISVVDLVLSVINIGATIYFGMKISKQVQEGLDSLNQKIVKFHGELKQRLGEISNKLNVIMKLNYRTLFEIQEVRRQQIESGEQILNKISTLDNKMDLKELTELIFNVKRASRQDCVMDRAVFRENNKKICQSFDRSQFIMASSVYNLKFDEAKPSISDCLSIIFEELDPSSNLKYPNIRKWFFFISLYLQFLEHAKQSTINPDISDPITLSDLDNAVGAEDIFNIISSGEAIKSGIKELQGVKYFLLVTSKTNLKESFLDAYEKTTGIPLNLELGKDWSIRSSNESKKAGTIAAIKNVLKMAEEGKVKLVSVYSLAVDLLLRDLVETLRRVLSKKRYEDIMTALPALREYDSRAQFESAVRDYLLSAPVGEPPDPAPSGYGAMYQPAQENTAQAVVNANQSEPAHP